MAKRTCCFCPQPAIGHALWADGRACRRGCAKHKAKAISNAKECDRRSGMRVPERSSGKWISYVGKKLIGDGRLIVTPGPRRRHRA